MNGTIKTEPNQPPQHIQQHMQPQTMASLQQLQQQKQQQQQQQQPNQNNQQPVQQQQTTSASAIPAVAALDPNKIMPVNVSSIRTYPGSRLILFFDLDNFTCSTRYHEFRIARSYHSCASVSVTRKSVDTDPYSSFDFINYVTTDAFSIICTAAAC